MYCTHYSFCSILSFKIVFFSWMPSSALFFHFHSFWFWRDFKVILEWDCKWHCLPKGKQLRFWLQTSFNSLFSNVIILLYTRLDTNLKGRAFNSKQVSINCFPIFRPGLLLRESLGKRGDIYFCNFTVDRWFSYKLSKSFDYFKFLDQTQPISKLASTL
jgi:hypothetical protein